jgi:hypothetical protein
MSMTSIVARVALVAGLALAQSGLPCGVSALADEAPRRYEFAFEPRSRALKPTAENASQLSATLDLLVRHGPRRELGFRIVGIVPESCLRTLDCAQGQLLRQRLQTLVVALQEGWPVQTGQAFTQELTWGGLPNAQTVSADPDRLMILLVTKPVEAPPGCLHRAELRDPALPGTVASPGVAEWIAITAERRIPISASAVLRIIDTARNTAELRSLAMSGDELRLPLPGRQGERSASSLALPNDNDARAVGDLLRPWVGAPAPSAAAQLGQDECTFVFERWRVDAR